MSAPKSIRGATAALAMTCALGVVAIVPAFADHDRHEEYRGHHREHHHPHGYVVEPAPVYAPPPVVYAPPPVSPGISIVFPIHFR